MTFISKQKQSLTVRFQISQSNFQMASNKILCYDAFSSFVHPSFWHKLAEIKLDKDKLNDAPKPIFGYYSNFDPKGCLLEVEYTAFNREFIPPKFAFTAKGQLINKNTIEDFRECDKMALIKAQGAQIWDVIKTGEWITNPSSLVQFLILSFADLKKFSFYYCFAFPAPLTENHHFVSDVEIDLDKLSECLKSQDFDHTFFIIKKSQNHFQHHKLSEFIDSSSKENFRNVDLNEYYFCYSDPSDDPNHPGWVLRLFLTALTYSCPLLKSQTINIIALKLDRQLNLKNTHCFKIELSSKELTEECPQFVGWELNSKGKFAPKMASMAESMDPQKLAENSINLNLKLMKWRLMPDLNLESISNAKCLLFGAGTLGCAVTRSLLAWGVNHITLIDYGTVSFSNPVRQNLYRYEDALNKRPKAETAAERLLEIHPGLTVKGYTIHVPMPGHSVGESLLNKTKADFEQIENLVKDHDVIFLLTDSRESRWLPTVMANVHNKIVLNAALGFDSYLVMRHGSDDPNNQEIPQVKGFRSITGNELGCYFCNDIVAPGNSLKDRTLDQQCTVTRPAVSNIAASLAVELLVSLLQHPQKEKAPAYIRLNNTEAESIPEGLMGIIPHSIRGSLPTFEHILPTTEKSPKCIACSKIITEEYRTKGFDFALEVFNSSKFLEDLTGITELLQEIGDIIECDGSDFELSD